MSAITSASSYRNWATAVRRATPWAHEWKVKDDRQIWHADLPNLRLREVYATYKKRNFGRPPNLFTGTVRGREVFVFSNTHGLNSPATVFIHDRAGRLIPGAGN